MANGELDHLQELARTNSSAIESADGCRTFELHWRCYVAYLATDECAGSCGNYDDEIYTGTLLRHYSKSHFLDYPALNTGGHTHTRPLQHYKLICLNHLINVASEHSPEIQIIRGEAQTGDLIH